MSLAAQILLARFLVTRRANRYARTIFQNFLYLLYFFIASPFLFNIANCVWSYYHPSVCESFQRPPWQASMYTEESSFDVVATPFALLRLDELVAPALSPYRPVTSTWELYRLDMSRWNLLKSSRLCFSPPSRSRCKRACEYELGSWNITFSKRSSVVSRDATIFIQACSRNFQISTFPEKKRRISNEILSYISITCWISKIKV